jgi:oligopeptide/dipeptide ABC transporter ATP-binding protein
MGTDAPLLELRDVDKTFVPRRGLWNRSVPVKAVQDVSLALRQGQTFGLVGETGSGKSTVGRLALGLERPTRGSVLVDGRPITTSSRQEELSLRRRLQVIFQDPYESLNPYLTVRETLEEPFRVHGLYRKDSTPAAIRELLDMVGFPASALNQSPHQFSGGQQQRIAIARALALRPALLVADEPTSALDVSIQAQILNLMMDIQRELGMAMLLISHNLLVVRHVSAEVGVMYGGRIVETGRSEQVYRSPLHPYTVALLSAIPQASPRKERERQRIKIAGEPPDPTALPPGCAFHTRCWMVVERCRTERPVLRPAGGHLVACHRAEEVTAPEEARAAPESAQAVPGPAEARE